MTLAQVRAAYSSLSGQTSASVRQLAFAGLGLVWVLKSGGAGLLAIHPRLLLPATLLIAGLGLDLLQSFWATGIWGFYQRWLELHGTPEDREFKAPRWFNWPTNVFFWGKLAVTSFAYAGLIRFMWRAVIL